MVCIYITTMQQSETPTDAFGDKMVFVDPYGDYLPKSENIPKTDGFVSGITHDGEIYCIDCAIDMGIVEKVDGEIMANVDGETIPTEKAPWTGKVLKTHETDTLMHCGCHSECLNAVKGENHPYNHNEPIGIGINEKTIQH